MRAIRWNRALAKRKKKRISDSLLEGGGRLSHPSLIDCSVESPRLVIALEHPVQHFSPAFRELEKRGRFDSRVLYWQDLRNGQHDQGFGQQIEWDIDLLTGYEYWCPGDSSAVIRILQTLGWLRSARPNCIVTFGWASPTARLALLYCTFARIPFLLYGDNSWQHRNPTGRNWLRDKVIGILCKRSAGAITTGTFNREDFIRLGIHPSRTFPGVYPISDTEFQVTNESYNRRIFTIGFAGKFIQRKGVDELLEALAYLPTGLPWQCVLVGEGPERSKLERLSKEVGISEQVRFLGFKNQSEMPDILRAMDILIVPSYVDMRVLIVSEAMAVGTPVVVSSGTAVWGEGDQVKHGETGWVYPSHQPEVLAQLLSELIADPDLLRKVAANALKLVPYLGPSAFTSSVEHAVKTVLVHE